MTKAIIILAGLLGIAVYFIIILLKKKTNININRQTKMIHNLNNQIDILVAKNIELKKSRERLKNESENNFNSDTGRAVSSDIANS